MAMRKTVFGGVAALSVATATLAHAAVVVPNPDGSLTFDAIDDTSTITFNGLGGDPQVVVPGLSSILTLTLTSITDTTFLFDYTLTNTSSIANTRVSGFGFNVDPNVDNVASTGTFDLSTLGGFTAGFNSETCFSGGTNPSTCPQGQVGSGVFFGSPGSGTLSLIYDDAPDVVELSNFLVRYQGFSTIVDGQNITSAVGVGVPGRGVPPPPPPIPEPATWATMILGFGMLGGMMRRRKRQSVRLSFS